MDKTSCPVQSVQVAGNSATQIVKQSFPNKNTLYIQCTDTTTLYVMIYSRVH